MTYFFIFLVLFSASGIVFLLVRQLLLIKKGAIKPKEDELEPINWMEFYGAFLFYFKKVWQEGARIFEKGLFLLRNGLFFLKTRKTSLKLFEIIVRFVNFVLGRFHIKNNGSSKYWEEIKNYKNKLPV